MKKIFNFVVISSVFIGGLFLNSNQIFINSSIGRDSLENVSLSDEGATEVSTAEGFMNAANNGENILLMNDIDFSEIDSDQTILENYTGTINGNGHSISNHHFSFSEDSSVTYLFESFNGVLENIDLDNFAFFAKEFVVDENNSSQAQISNVTFENITIQNENFYNINNEPSLGLFAGSILGNYNNEAESINFEKILINNISFTNNLLDFSNSDISETFDLGIFSGAILGYGNIDQLAIENITFDNNEVNTVYKNEFNELNISTDTINLGIFSGEVSGLNITNSFINGVSIQNNSFYSSKIALGSFIGNYQNGSSDDSEYFYANNLNISNNDFYFSTNNGHIGSLFGEIYFNPQYGNFNSFIAEKATLESNSFFNLNNNIKIEYNIEDVYGYTQEIGFFNSETSYIITNKANENDPTNEFTYILETKLTKTFWEDNGFDSSIWNLDDLYLSSTKVDEESYGYPLLFFLPEIELVAPTFTLTNDFDVYLYGNSLKSNNVLTFNLTLNNPDNLNISIDDDEVVLTLHSSFYDFNGQNYKEITFGDFLNSENSNETENTLSYKIDIDSFVQNQTQLNKYYWIDVNDEFLINYKYLNGEDIYSNTNVINFDIENSFLTNVEESESTYDINQKFVLDLKTTYKPETNELTFYLDEKEHYDYDFYYSLNLTLSSTTKMYDIHLDSDHPSQTIQLDENLPQRLAEGKSINDFYTINLKQTKSNKLNSSSYVVYLNEVGKLQKIYINDISSENLKEISNNVYLEGDLINTNSSATLENIDNNIEPPVEQQQNKQSTIISISILLALFLLIILIYLIVHFKKRRKNISDSE